MEVIKFVLSNIKPFKWHYLFMFLVPIITSCSTPLYYYAVKLLIDFFTVANHFTYYDIIFPISLLIASEFFNILLWHLSVYTEVRAEPYVRANITAYAFKKVMGYDYKYFQNSFAGNIVSKIAGCANGYDKLWIQFNGKLTQHMTGLVLCATCLLLVSYKIVLLVFTWIILNFYIVFPLLKKLVMYTEESSDAQHEGTAKINDCIANITTVKAFARCEQEYKNVKKFLNKKFVPLQQRAYYQYLKIMLVLFPTYLITMTVCLFMMIENFRSGLITLGDFAYTFGLLFSISNEAFFVLQSTIDALQDFGALSSSYNVLRNNPTILDTENSKKTPTDSSIEIKNIGFSYNDKTQVFDNFSLSIQKNEKIGLVGPSGAGKTTLIHLLLRFFDINSGEIIIGNCNIKEIKQDILRQSIAHIPQDTALFHRTLSENIAYANDGATTKDIIKVAKDANINDFINELPNKYDTLVGERGMKLSGGQRQRIAIARAFLKDAPILILDEATSALDSKTEQQIQRSIAKILANKNKTVVAIAHRLSTLKQMDRIIVIDKGRIVQDGSHHKLVRQEGVYKDLWQMQSGGFIAE